MVTHARDIEAARSHIFQGNRVLMALASGQASCHVCRLFTVLTIHHTRPHPSTVSLSD